MVDVNEQARSGAPSSGSPIPARIARVRALFADAGVDAVLVRATDRFLNEYVPTDESTRVWLSGFTGSMGDALLTRDRALLVVDGRYVLQAGREAPDFETVVVPLGTSIEIGLLNALEELAGQGVARLGVETERVSASLYARILEKATALGVTVVPTTPSLLERARLELGPPLPAGKGDIWAIDAKLSGRTVQERVALAASFLEAHKLDGLVVFPLDEIAWISNLRGTQFSFQATFKSKALVARDRVIVALERGALRAGVVVEPGCELVDEDGFAAAIAARGAQTLGIELAKAPEAARAALAALPGVTLSPIESPFGKLRATKTPAELLHMQDAFGRADRVVDRLQAWLSSSVSRGDRVTEKDVARQTEALFLKSGAFGLSFKVIAAAGKNGAVIHYSTPNDEVPIREGELFLLDTGAYYDGGYATDLTRTFLVGKGHVKATDEQKRLFTVVLQGAIAGMSARIPKGSTGEQLDALVRQPLWREGLDFAHGTGHGVGVNVHEFPPRVAPGVRAAVEVGQVFSIEPGVYLPGIGGVRIENLVTCVADPDDARFVRIKPLTFSPLDQRLIDKARLSASERNFLQWFRAASKRPSEAGLPPLS